MSLGISIELKLCSAQGGYGDNFCDAMDELAYASRSRALT